MFVGLMKTYSIAPCVECGCATIVELTLVEYPHVSGLCLENGFRQIVAVFGAWP